jgi:hypothetical protein
MNSSRRGEKKTRPAGQHMLSIGICFPPSLIRVVDRRRGALTHSEYIRNELEKALGLQEETTKEKSSV